MSNELRERSVQPLAVPRYLVARLLADGGAEGLPVLVLTLAVIAGLLPG